MKLKNPAPYSHSSGIHLTYKKCCQQSQNWFCFVFFFKGDLISEGSLQVGGFFFVFFFKFIYFWLCWVFVSVRGLSLVVASGDHSSLRCAGLPLSRPLPLRSTGSRRAGSVIMDHGPSRSAARGILPDQGPNPCPLHWQADPQPLRHQGSPKTGFWKEFKICFSSWLSGCSKSQSSTIHRTVQIM